MKSAPLIFLFFLISLFSSLQGAFPNRSSLIVVKHPEYIADFTIGQSLRFPGMFGVYFAVVGCLNLFEEEHFGGIRVDFEDLGLYYDKEMGPNWWSYYCEPIDIQKGKCSQIRYYEGHHCWEKAWKTEFELSKERINELITKYIKFKPCVTEPVDTFAKEYFGEHHVIGVHYRGTDKASEAPKVPFEIVSQKIEDYISENSLSDYIIFVATDEQAFIEYIKDIFPNKVIFTHSERANDDLPLHYHTKKPFQQGLEATVDCLLLSKSHVLFRTSSNLSLWSTFFNPTLPAYEFSKRN